MQSWEKPYFKIQANATVHIWRGDEMEELVLHAGNEFDPLGVYQRDPKISYIEICIGTKCIAHYRLTDLPQDERNQAVSDENTVLTGQGVISSAISQFSI